METTRRAVLAGLIVGLLIVVLALPVVVAAVPTAPGGAPSSTAYARTPSVMTDRSVPASNDFVGPPVGAAATPLATSSAVLTSPIPQAASPLVLTSWDALRFGPTNGWVPPDVQVAGGPNHVVEMVNLLMGVYTKSGTQVSVTGLASFFNSGTDFISDPKIQYDVASGRWFASVTDVTTSAILLAVSTSNDPTSTWHLNTISGTGCLDQPILGVGSLSVILSVNVFSSCTTSGKYVGASYWVVNKTDLTSGVASPRSFQVPANINDFSLHPVQVLGTSSVHYLVATYWPGALITSNVLQLITVSGVPPAVPVITEKDILIPLASLAPSSPQLGSAATIDSGDIRVSDAVYHDGRIWLGFSASCLPAGDTTNRSCARMIELDATSGAVLQDFSIGASHKYLYYPAMRTDAKGDMAVVLGYSSSTEYPSVVATGQVYGDPANTWQPLVMVRAGTGPEDPSRLCSTVCRFGDYFGAGLDPSDSTTVWLAAEFGTASGWGTSIFGAKIRAMLTLSYGILGGGSGYTAPNLSYTVNGSAANVVLGTSPSTYLADPGTLWFVTGTLGGSTATERWAADANATPPLQGLANRSVSGVYAYFHQYAITFTSSVVGGGSPGTPVVDFTTFGVQGWAPTNQPYWVDAGTEYVFQDPLAGSTTNERWDAADSGIGNVTGPGTASMTYYHQYRVTFTFTVDAGNGYGVPSVAFPQFGSSFSAAAPTTAWVDAGGAYAYEISLPGSTSTMRWGATANATGTVSAPGTITVPYKVQYYVTVVADPAGAGALLTGGGWYNANATVTLGASSNGSWQFHGWIGSGEGSFTGSGANPTLTISSPIIETAIFYPGLTITAGPGGSVTYAYGSVSGTVAAGTTVTVYVPVGTTVSLTANPGSWADAFTSWSGAASGTSGTTTVAVSAPGAAIATFGASVALLVVPILIVVAVIGLVVLLIVRRRKRAEPPPPPPPPPPP